MSMWKRAELESGPHGGGDRRSPLDLFPLGHLVQIRTGRDSAAFCPTMMAVW